MKKFVCLFIFLTASFFLTAENVSWDPCGMRWKPPPKCSRHDFDIPRRMGVEAGVKAWKMGYLRYVIMAPEPEIYVRRWDYADSYSAFRSKFQEFMDPRWERFSANWDLVIPVFEDAYRRVTDWLLNDYNLCLQNHQPQENQQRGNAHYQRALIFFDQGDICSALSDMYAVINLGASSEMQLALGQTYNDANQFLHAIKVLSELLEKEPKNKEAYFERALAYFEIGDFSKSMDDYLASSIRPTLLRDQGLKYKHLKFSLGIGTGILKGSFSSVYDFAPSLLSAFHGLSTGLWAFASDPIGLSVEFVEAAHEIIEFIKENATTELIANLIPELKECIQQWENLDEQTKGHYLGYVIGHYGLDCLIWKGSLQTVRAFQRLKRANSTLIFETACLSSKQAEEILVGAKKFWQTREEYKAKCFLHIDKQNKHIRHTHNFELGRSEITIPLEKLEALAQKKLGQGIPEKGMHLGEIDYKEIVNFGEEIGLVISKEEELLGPTTWGKIHYGKNGGYHIVPSLSPEGIR